MGYRRHITYTLNTTIPADRTAQENEILIKRPFVLRQITNGSPPSQGSGSYRVNVVSQLQNVRFFDEEIREDLIVGVGGDANLLWKGFVFQQGERLIVSLDNETSSDNEVRIDFHGYELVDESVGLIDIPEPGWMHMSYMFRPDQLAADGKLEEAGFNLEADFKLRAWTIIRTGAFEFNIFQKRIGYIPGERLFVTAMRDTVFNGNVTDYAYMPEWYVEGGRGTVEDLAFDLRDKSSAPNTILIGLHGVEKTNWQPGLYFPELAG